MEPRLSVTCCRCGQGEFFEGDLASSIKALNESGRWFTNKRELFVCGSCRSELNVAADQERKHR